MGSVTCTLIRSFQMSACRPTTSFPTSDLREREHFCLISFEKCGERVFYSRGSARRSCQCVIRFKLPPTAVDCLGSELADSHGRGRSRHASTYLIQKLS